jgi:hypothetical protein
MKRTRYNKTPFFAAAFYACACLLVYGTVAAAHARHPAHEANIRLRQPPQLCGTGRTIAVDFARGFASASRASRGSLFFSAMLSTIIAAEQNLPQQFEQVRAPLPLRERHAIRYPILSYAVSCALLSRQLADA